MARQVTEEEWNAEGERRFGADRMLWRFICPSCGHVAAVKDWKAAGAPESAAAFSCVGRWTGAGGEKAFFLKGGPCNYAGGGLFKLNPVTVGDSDFRIFEFASDPLPAHPGPA